METDGNFALKWCLFRIQNENVAIQGKLVNAATFESRHCVSFKKKNE